MDRVGNSRRVVLWVVVSAVVLTGCVGFGQPKNCTGDLTVTVVDDRPSNATVYDADRITGSEIIAIASASESER